MEDVLEHSAMTKRSSLMYARYDGAIVLYFGDRNHPSGRLHDWEKQCSEWQRQSCQQSFAVIGSGSLSFLPWPGTTNARTSFYGPLVASPGYEYVTEIDRYARQEYMRLKLTAPWTLRHPPAY